LHPKPNRLQKKKAIIIFFILLNFCAYHLSRVDLFVQQHQALLKRP